MRPPFTEIRILRPDITGRLDDNYGGPRMADSFGAIHPHSLSAGPKHGTADAQFMYGNIGFFVSAAEGIYGSASTVQPASLRMMPIIRT